MALTYLDVRQKSSHNSFYQREGIYDQFLFWRIHSLEFDLNPEPQDVEVSGSEPTPSRDWFVYEDPFKTNVNRLSDAIDVLKGIHFAEPAHEVITVFLCLKKPMVGEGHTPDVLDDIVTTFGASLPDSAGRSAVYAASAHEASGTWPALDDLRGKFIFALTGNPFLPAFRDYQDQRRAAQEPFSIFLAPELDDAGGMASGAAFLAAFKAAWPKASFANINFHTWKDTPGLSDVPQRLFETGIVSRAYPRTLQVPLVEEAAVDNLNDPDEWGRAKLAGFHHIATNKINSFVDPFSCTNAPNGWPFEPRAGAAGQPPALVGRAVIRVDVTSGDIFGDEDSFAFAHAQFRQDEANRRVAFYIASPNSNVEGWAKGALMARASLEKDADYFALVRPADDHRFQVQWRKKGQSTSRYKEVFLGDNAEMKATGFHIKPDTLVFGRLDILNNGFRAAAYVALHWAGPNTQWFPLAEEVFDHPLVFQGLAASSHGNQAITFQFGDLGEKQTFPALTLSPIGDDVTFWSSGVNSYPTSG